MKTHSSKLTLAALLPLCAMAFAPLTLAENAKPATTQSANPQTAAAPERLVCNHVRILPREGFPQLVKGALLQGSDTGPTTDFETLATVTEEGRDGQWMEIKFKNTKVYRFLRYYAPKDSWCNVAELEFCHDDTKLRGQPFGTYGTRGGRSGYDKAFDGSPKTFFDAPLPDDQYAGIELVDLPAVTPPEIIPGGSRTHGAHCHIHIGNSLTDNEYGYSQVIAKAAGFADDTYCRVTIPGAPIHGHWNWAIRREKTGLGARYLETAEKFAPVSDLILQCFVSNGDTANPTPLVGFYDMFKERSPGVRLWIYGAWAGQTGLSHTDLGENEVIALHRVYVQAAMNAQKMRPTNPPVAVIPGGYALIHLKRAIEKGAVPGINKDDFFAKMFSDGLHINALGGYFIGLVHYACIYDKSPVGVVVPMPLPDKAKTVISPELNKALEEIAWESVQSWRVESDKWVSLPVPGEIDAADYICSIPPHKERTSTPSVTWAHTEELSYFIMAQDAGKFLLKVNAILNDVSPKGTEVFLNDAPVGTVEYPDVAAKKETLAESKALPLTLKKGLNTLRLFLPKNESYFLDTLRITHPDGSGIKQTLPFCDAHIYSNMDLEPGQTVEKTFHVSDAATPAGQIKVTAIQLDPNQYFDGQIKVPAHYLDLTQCPANTISVEAGNDGTRKLIIKHPGTAGISFVLVTIANNAGLSRSFSFRLNCK